MIKMALTTKFAPEVCEWAVRIVRLANTTVLSAERLWCRSRR